MGVSDEPEGTPLERLEARSAEIEQLATEVAVRAKAFGGDVGARSRIELVKERLKVALDELGGYPFSAADITDE
ncbi:MAG TPA: hypothetical protein VGX96_20130 [Candidatus Elarobacter sp.]|jgi:hypothetical protein|nr:hypothetical protein [Candidatus Elarobacter sp.]